MKIGVIGLGNMAGAMIGGLIAKGFVKAEEICGSDANQEMEEKRAKEFGICIAANNRETAKEADYLILAVKPQFASEVIAEIKDNCKAGQVVISIMAGKSIEWISTQFGREIKLVRCMPNTAALVGEAITALSPSDNVGTEELDTVKHIIESFGKAEVVPERLMDSVVGVSGSAPAYVFMMMEAMADAAVEGGMPRQQAYTFAAQAVLGSAKLMLETGKHPGELKDMVCSPAGTTIAAVRVLEENGFRGAVIDAVEAAIKRSSEL
ncbi:MAG: pyrroline-5-carboxylate reductase [Lachnospiraceae bacterium]|nr:pyrroline-5-carboxylate reductase [Lachnospiraceae bacterium]